jgi:AraC family transcriptional regulator of adaptative response/methylated-DNA-[protein]-cysteine methyltransferase
MSKTLPPPFALKFTTGECTLGDIHSHVLVARSEQGICAILLGDTPHVLRDDLQQRFPKAQLNNAEAELKQTLAQVIALIKKPHHIDSPLVISLDISLDIRGTVFQQHVWQVLRNIPVGATMSYSEIAQALGAPQSARAVAGACAANALAVVIPCHRVIRSDGALSGYRWGTERKRALLELERESLAVRNKTFKA